MTDDLEDLKSALRAATPTPDAAAKAANLKLAQNIFAGLQGTSDGSRPMSDRPVSGIWTGARQMMTSISSRAGLVATTAIVAVAFVTLVPVNDTTILLPQPELPIAQLKDELTNAGRTESDVAAAPPAAELRVQPAKPAIEEFERVGEAEIAASPQSAIAGAQNLKRDDRSRTMADTRFVPEADTETYANADQNPVRITTETPISTFSIDVDTASYAVVRNSIMNGQLPPEQAVRIEEMINYFPYDYPAPDSGGPFLPAVSVTQTPWNEDTRLVHIGIQGAMPDIGRRPPLNLVFLIDTSGSMDAPNKLPLLKQSFRLMLGQLRPTDQVAIVTYAGSSGEVLAPTPASESGKILQSLDQLGAGGSTAGQAGLAQAYTTAAAMAETGEVSRVILATDGDFNVGMSDPDALKDYIAKQRDTGIYLSVLGFGRGNLDDTTMQALAQNGNGQAAYIDTLAEAQKVLADQLTGALFPIANDVKIQVEFNPAQVAEYRLIGYETRILNRTDFNNDAVDAGDIGAGHSVTALYEITPVGSPAQLSEPLRYQAAEPESTSRELGHLRIRYKTPGASSSQLIEAAITPDLPTMKDTVFTAAIAGFGQLLRGSANLGDWGYDDAIALANNSRGEDAYGYRTEAVKLMRLAKSLSRQ